MNPAVSTMYKAPNPVCGYNPVTGTVGNEGAVGTPGDRSPRPGRCRPAEPAVGNHAPVLDPRARVEPMPLGRRQISHDIHHEFGTITMLASLLSVAPDVGAESRERARQILGEMRWLDELHREYEALAGEQLAPGHPGAVPTRLDTLAADVVAAMRLSTLTRISYTATDTWAHVDRLAYWRALRNVIGNAIRAAGRSGTVVVQAHHDGDWAVTQIDDDGPGPGQAPPGHASLGLGIVQDMATAHGGHLTIRTGRLGGCCVRLLLPDAGPRAAG